MVLTADTLDEFDVLLLSGHFTLGALSLPYLSNLPGLHNSASFLPLHSDHFDIVYSICFASVLLSG